MEAIKEKFRVENEQNRIGHIDEQMIESVCGMGEEVQTYVETSSLALPGEYVLYELMERQAVDLTKAKGILCAMKVHKDAFDFSDMDALYASVRKQANKKRIPIALQYELVEDGSFKTKSELCVVLATGGGDYIIQRDGYAVACAETPKDAYRKAEEMYEATGLFHEVLQLS